MKVQFDIKYRAQIESGEYKVETRNGVPVKLLFINSHNAQPIIGELELNGKTVYISTDENGSWTEGNGENQFDLFIVTPEPELTEFEQSVRDCIIENLTTHGREMSSTVFIDDDTAKKMATELFGLARNQLQKEGLVTMEHLNIACEAEYQSGLADGKNEALNDLPRWKKIGRGNNYSSEVKFAINGRYLEMNDTLNDVYEVALSNLEKLPKED